MISLGKRSRKSDDDEEKRPPPSSPAKGFQSTSSLTTNIRDRLLQREVMELNPEVLPPTVRVRFPNTHGLHQFYVVVRPVEGFWAGGAFNFEINVPPEYNMTPPKVKCLTQAWHPNIDPLRGEVCLSLLRVSTVDDMGWTPTRQLKDVVLGLDGLFNDLVNFDDPLNQDAADQYRTSRDVFVARIREMIRNGSRPRQ